MHAHSLWFEVKRLWYPLDGPQKWEGCFGEEKNVLSQPDIKTVIPQMSRPQPRQYTNYIIPPP
jgi:hypothetical protein